MRTKLEKLDSKILLYQSDVNVQILPFLKIKVHLL